MGEGMKNYKTYVPCCASCQFVVHPQREDFFCKFGFDEPVRKAFIDLDYIAFELMLEDEDKGVEPHGHCDAYRSKRQGVETSDID